MSQEPVSKETGGRAAILQMVAGGAIVLAMLAVFVSGKVAGLRSFLPMAGTGGLVLFGIGLHGVLWSGPRAGSRVPRSFRGLVSAGVAFGLLMAVSMVIGAGVGLSRRYRGAAQAGWTETDRLRFERSCADRWREGDLGAPAMASPFCTCWRSFAEARFPDPSASIRLDPSDPEVERALAKCIDVIVK